MGFSVLNFCDREGRYRLGVYVHQHIHAQRKSMSESKLIVILANSIRSTDRCIAGKELVLKEDGTYDVGPWIRLADRSTKEGAVPANVAYCAGHRWVKILDVVRVVLQFPCDNPDHPEDWWLEPHQPWEFVETRTVADLPNFADHPYSLWHTGESDAVFAGYVRDMGVQAASLYLVKAPEQWSLTYYKEYNSFKGYDKKYRKLELTFAGKYHEFSVTDLGFDRRFNLPSAVSQWPNPGETLTVPNPAGCYFCLSLTPEFNSRHYKVCATIFET
jgi:hypothetical protein